jgi:hypothetical protein
MWCGGGRHPPPRTLAGVRLPSSRASPETALRGVKATGPPLSSGMKACRCVPPTIAGEYGNGFTRCGGGRHPPPSKDGRLPVHASHRRRRVREWLRAVWRRPAPYLPPGVDACRCAPPTIAGESGNGSMRCGGGRHPSISSRRGHLPVHASHYRGRVREWLCAVWRWPTPTHLGADAYQCVPRTIVGEYGNGSTVWRRLAPPSVQAWTVSGARFPPSWVGHREHSQRFWEKAQLRLVWASDEKFLLEGVTEEPILLLLLDRPDQCSYPPTQGSGESLVKLLLS